MILTNYKNFGGDIIKKFFYLIESCYDKVRNFFLTDYSLSFWTIIKFLLLTIFNFLIFFIGFYLNLRLTLPDSQELTSHQWVQISLGSLILITITYFINKFRDWRKNRRLGGDKIIFDIIGGAIQELMELHINSPSKRDRYIIEILNNIEKVLESIFKGDGIELGTLCANLMVREGNHLKLTEFGTKFQDRDKPKIDFDETNPLPGAPEAWILSKVIYIEDIKSEKYAQYFQANFKFKSFISVPIVNDGTVIAVINVDSNIVKQFKSNEYIAQNIMPKISPFLSLYNFEQGLRKL